MYLKDMVILWSALFLCTAAIFYGGRGLSRYGDIIAEKTGLGGAWVGMILMATVTSLPELVTGIGAVAVFDTPDIAAGDVLGACVINFLIIALLDLLEKEPISGRIHEGHILSASFVIILGSIVLVSIFVGGRAGQIGWISPSSLIILFLYPIGMRLIFFHERRRFAAYAKKMAQVLKYEKVTIRQAVNGYAFYAGIVLIAALWLPSIGDKLATATGLGQTFVGSVFIALSTTLPEISLSLAAVRIGASDMAVGNLLGSNMFNIALLGLDDFLYAKAPFFSVIEKTHIVTAVSVILMSAVVIAGISYRAKKKLFILSWDTIALLLVAVLNVLVLYALR